MIKAEKTEVKKELVPAGTHIARVYEIIQVGTVKEEWEGESKDTPKVRISWELPLELHTYGTENKPMVISREFTLSMGAKSNLRPIVEGVLGAPLQDQEAYAFDIEKLLGEDSLVTIVHKPKKSGGTYAFLSASAPLMKGQVCPEPFNKPKILSYDNWDEAFFNSLPDFLKEKMSETPEYKEMRNPKGSVTADTIEYPENRGEKIPF